MNITYDDKDHTQPTTDPRRVFSDVDANEIKSVVNGNAGVMLNMRGNWDNTQNKFPDSGGSGTSGVVKKWDCFDGVGSGTWEIISGDGATTVPDGTFFIARVNNPGNDPDNWRTITNGGGGSDGDSTSVEAVYANIAAMLAAQGAQRENALYYVTTATTDPTVTAGWAIYRKLAATTANLTDYIKIQEQESIDVIPTPDWDETTKGKAEKATQAETNEGTDDLRGVTPLKVKVKNRKSVSPTANTTINQADHDQAIIFADSATPIQFAFPPLEAGTYLTIVQKNTGGVSWATSGGTTFIGAISSISGSDFGGAVTFYYLTTTSILIIGGYGGDSTDETEHAYVMGTFNYTQK